MEADRVSKEAKHGRAAVGAVYDHPASKGAGFLSFSANAHKLPGFPFLNLIQHPAFDETNEGLPAFIAVFHVLSFKIGHAVWICTIGDLGKAVVCNVELIIHGTEMLFQTAGFANSFNQFRSAAPDFGMIDFRRLQPLP